MDVNVAGASNVDAVVLGTGVGNVSFVGGTIGTTALADVLAKGIEMQDTTAELLVDGVKFRNCAVEISIPGHLIDGSKISNCTSDRTDYNRVDGDLTTASTAISDVVVLTGSTSDINSIEYGWDGRQLVLVSDTNTMTYKHQTGGTDGVIHTHSGADVVVAANKAIRLTYSTRTGARGWYQSI